MLARQRKDIGVPGQNGRIGTVPDAVVGQRILRQFADRQLRQVELRQKTLLGGSHEVAGVDLGDVPLNVAAGHHRLELGVINRRTGNNLDARRLSEWIPMDLAVDIVQHAA